MLLWFDNGFVGVDGADECEAVEELRRSGFVSLLQPWRSLGVVQRVECLWCWGAAGVEWQ